MSTWLDHGETRYLLRRYFWTCLWRCFWTVAIESIDWVELFAFLNVGGYHPICWGHEYHKKRWRKGVPTLTIWLVKLGHLLSPALCALVLRPSDSDSNLHCQLSGPQASELHHQHFWFSNLHKADHRIPQPSWLHESISHNKCIHRRVYIVHILLVTNL